MKHDEPPLFGAGRTIVDGKPLTTRQQAAWDHVRRTGRVTEDEIGALMHALRGRHTDDARCTWCQQEGAGVLRSHALRTLVTRKRTGYWEPRDPKDSLAEATAEPIASGERVASTSDGSYDPRTSEFPF